MILMKLQFMRLFTSDFYNLVGRIFKQNFIAFLQISMTSFEQVSASEKKIKTSISVYC